MKGTKLYQRDPDIDINREKYWNQRMKDNREDYLKEKPLDIMFLGKRPCSGTEGEDYSLGGPMRDMRGRTR